MLLKTSKKTTQKERESNAMQICMLGEEQKKKTERNYNFYINIYIITGQANRPN